MGDTAPNLNRVEAEGSNGAGVLSTPKVPFRKFIQAWGSDLDGTGRSGALYLDENLGWVVVETGTGAGFRVVSWNGYFVEV